MLKTLPETLLYIAQRKCQPQAFRMLFSTKASMSTSQTTTSCTFPFSSFLTVRTPLHTAAVFGNLKFVEDILSRGAKVNLRNKEGKDAYDLAVKYGRSDIAALLNKKSNQITTQRQQLAHGTKTLSY